MSDSVTKRLGAGLSADSLHLLKEITGHHRHLRQHSELVRQGEIMPCCHFVLDGIVCRYKVLPGGRRVTLAFLLPGDFCASHPELSGSSDCGLASLTQATVAEVPRALLQESMRADAGLAQNLATACRIQIAIQRQWLATMSCLADKRMAHLFCELRARLAQIDLADEESFFLPLTQQELGEAVGLSTVHVNRTLQHLKGIGLLRVVDHRVIIGDLRMLERFAEFDPTYLGIASEPAELQALAGHDVMASILQRRPAFRSGASAR